MKISIAQLRKIIKESFLRDDPYSEGGMIRRGHFKKKKIQAEEEGLEARKLNIPRKNNPYAGEGHYHSLYKAWNVGWDNADFDMSQQKMGEW